MCKERKTARKERRGVSRVSDDVFMRRVVKGGITDDTFRRTCTLVRFGSS
jgi:hypothetical protein